MFNFCELDECKTLALKISKLPGIAWARIGVGEDHDGDECVFVHLVMVDPPGDIRHDEAAYRQLFKLSDAAVEIVRCAVYKARCVPFSLRGTPTVYSNIRTVSEMAKMKEPEWQPLEVLA